MYAGIPHSPERQAPQPREIGQNEVCRRARGHRFGDARQQREPGHNGAELAQLTGVQLQAALDQDRGERRVSAQHA